MAPGLSYSFKQPRLRERPRKAVENTSAIAIALAQASLYDLCQYVVGNKLACRLNLSNLVAERRIAEGNVAQNIAGGNDWQVEAIGKHLGLRALTGSLWSH